MRTWKMVVLILTTAMVTAWVTVAFASGTNGSATARTVTQVKELWHTAPPIGAAVGAGWVDVAHTSITVPAGSKAIVDVTTDVTGYCLADPAAGFATNCNIRVLIGGHEAKPANAAGIVIAAPNSTVEGQWMTERSSLPLGPGTYPVIIQHEAQGDANGYFGIEHWHIRVDRIAV